MAVVCIHARRVATHEYTRLEVLRGTARNEVEKRMRYNTIECIKNFDFF